MPTLTQRTSARRSFRAVLSFVVFLVLAFAVLTLLGHAAAQSGGGFGGSTGGGSGSGGGSFGGGYSGGGSFPGGGYSGGYSGPIIVGGGGFGPGYGYSGGGGFGLIGLLVFGLVILTVVGFMRRSLGSGGGGRGLAGMGSLSGTAQAVSVQLLLAEGDEVKRALQQIARSGDPDTNEGLARMLQEAALVLLRHPERWVYGNVERAQGPASSADSQVGAWATEARAAFTEQTTSNYQNRDPYSGFSQRQDYTFQKDVGDLYLAVTIAVAAHALGNLPPAGVTTLPEVRAALMAISSVNPGDLIRAEVVWSPDVEGEFLSEEEAIQKYPKLTKL
ncbi:DUF1517 domain-containing protein [Deinococcus sp. YIM 77859]|uniref:DUF1517 domain-containing protein n=1 Tax=Deinococcus sp. YIM 77859 TaxID=1540221 RepID=UPI00055133F5|nr:DUF1517 domain-containing protein [Deinococcus sp. YIM 77859]